MGACDFRRIDVLAGGAVPRYMSDEISQPGSALAKDLTLAHREAVRVVLRMSGSRADAEDCAQKAVVAFLEMVRDLGEKDIENLDAYLTTSARNAYRAMMRAKKSIPMVYDQLIRMLDDEVRDHGELTALISALRDTLTSREVTVLFMHCVDRYTYGEISDMTAIGSTASIGILARGAVKKLHGLRNELGL